MYRDILVIMIFPFMIICIFLLWQIVHGEKDTQQKSNYVLTTLPDTPSKAKPSRPTPVATTTPTATTSSPVIVTTTDQSNPATSTQPIQPAPLLNYLEITTGCNLVVDSTCVKAYSQPDATSRVKSSLRIGTVLFIKRTLQTEQGETWYEIGFPEHLRYSARLSLPWYIPATAGQLVRLKGASDLTDNTPTSTKKIIVDRSDQTLTAYDGETLIKTYTVSTGLESTPTPRGNFTVFRKTPSRYMQGPIPGISTNYYDLPGVPWNLYFTKQGAVVHGAYWHDDFGHQHSNGCVNVDPKQARELYDWADLGMTIIVRD